MRSCSYFLSIRPSPAPYNPKEDPKESKEGGDGDQLGREKFGGGAEPSEGGLILFYTNIIKCSLLFNEHYFISVNL